jgi:hypothetical protein
LRAREQARAPDTPRELLSSYITDDNPAGSFVAWLFFAPEASE